MHEHARQRTQTELTGPFAGVPLLVKDLFQQYAGYPTSFGCQGLKRVASSCRTKCRNCKSLGK